MAKIKEALERWEQTTLRETLEASPERAPAFKTESDIPVKRVYTPLDLEGKDYNDCLGFPGDYPYTRGVYPTM